MKTRLGKITLATAMLVGALCVGVALFQARADPLDTHHSSWHLVRATATEDGANFAAVYNLASNGGDYASGVANGGAFQIRSKGEPGSEGVSPGAVWMFAICGGLADNDTFSFDVAGWAKTNGMLQVLAVCDGVIGTQDVVTYPGGAAATNIWWADTINLDSVTPVRWPGVSVRNSGNNEVAILLIDTAGLEFIQFVFYDCDGGGTEANNITVFGRRY
jgi:hypothetical protein